MRVILPLSLLWSLFLLSGSLQAQNFGNGFPFYMPPGDSTAQRFLPEFAKQPITNFVGINADGHFEAGGQRLRFWGVNVTEGACFPKKKQSAVGSSADAQAGHQPRPIYRNGQLLGG